MPQWQAFTLSHTQNLEITLTFGHAMIQSLVIQGVKAQLTFKFPGARSEVIYFSTEKKNKGRPIKISAPRFQQERCFALCST
ncbi:hypothetical protein SD80_011120 [Scytonema tolypothrichoides VB-61278]|nr:hypothetical protein SD80_011120 [Scytonema tolypothrichoides VB-61278]